VTEPGSRISDNHYMVQITCNLTLGYVLHRASLEKHIEVLDTVDGHTWYMTTKEKTANERDTLIWIN
jgi:hypothetical protein